MTHLATADIRGVLLRHAWTTALTLYIAESAIVESVRLDHGMTSAFGQHFIGVTSILIAFSYGYAGPDGLLRALPGGAGGVAVHPAMRSEIGLDRLTAAVPSMIDVRRLLQGTAAVWIFTGSVYVVSQGAASGVLVWVVSLTQRLGLAGGFAGKLLFDPLIESGIDWHTAFIVSGIAGAGLAAVILLNRPAGGGRDRPAGISILALVRSYHATLANRQIWLCGIVAGLLFAPLTTGGMTWSLAFFKNDLHLGGWRAAMAMGLVAVGWLVGRPLVAFLADRLGQGKPVVLAGALVMIAAIGQITMWTSLMSPLGGMFVFGVASASTVIPYKILRKANVSREEGRGMGAFKALHLLVIALIGVVFHGVFGPAGENSTILSSQLHEVGAFWAATLLAAMVFAAFLREADGRTLAGRPA
jgi:hypothetical protein